MRILKKLLIAVAAVILVVALAIVVAGPFVPAERSFTNEIDINAPADRQSSEQRSSTGSF